MLGHGQVQRDDGQRRQRQYRQQLRPVGGVLPLQPGDGQQHGLLVLVGDEDQREPQVVPDRHQVVDGHRRQCRAYERYDDAVIDHEPVRAVHKRRLVQLAGQPADELREYEHRRRKAHGDIDRIQAPQRVQQPEVFHQLQQPDRGDLDGQHHAHDEEEVDALGRPGAPVGQRVGGQRPQEQYHRQRAHDDHEGVPEVIQKVAAADDGSVVVQRPVQGHAEGIGIDLLLRLQGIDDQYPHRRHGDGRPEDHDDVIANVALV